MDILVRSFVCNTNGPSVKQSMKCHVCSTLAHGLADLPPPQLQASSGQAWQFHISTVRPHIGRSTGTCRLPYIAHADLPLHMQIYPLINSNADLRFILIDSYPQSRSLNIVPADLHLAPADLPPPPSIEHRCLEYHYTKLGRSTTPQDLPVHLNGHF